MPCEMRFKRGLDKSKKAQIKIGLCPRSGIDGICSGPLDGASKRRHPTSAQLVRAAGAGGSPLDLPDAGGSGRTRSSRPRTNGGTAGGDSRR